jgi:hypothetical protein
MNKYKMNKDTVSNCLYNLELLIFECNNINSLPKDDVGIHQNKCMKLLNETQLLCQKYIALKNWSELPTFEEYKDMLKKVKDFKET